MRADFAERNHVRQLCSDSVSVGVDSRADLRSTPWQTSVSNCCVLVCRNPCDTAVVGLRPWWDAVVAIWIGCCGSLPIGSLDREPFRPSERVLDLAKLRCSGRLCGAGPVRTTRLPASSVCHGGASQVRDARSRASELERPRRQRLSSTRTWATADRPSVGTRLSTSGRGKRFLLAGISRLGSAANLPRFQ